MKELIDLKPGESGIIKKISGAGALRRRIIDMGLTPGIAVKMIKAAPLGDPLEIYVRGYTLSLRKSEARKIELCSQEDFSKKTDAKNPNFVNIPNKNAGITILPIVPENSFHPTYTAALVGNPNSGKTTLFNRLTGTYEYVGNWPGVTVSRKEGRIKELSEDVNLVDLPGVYSLSPYSPEEIVTRSYILEEKPDVLINIIDSTNLERNLYLTTQLLELDFRMILALNMTDLLSQKGKIIDCKALEERLGIPVVPISAGKNRGIDELTKEVLKLVKDKSAVKRSTTVYSEETEKAVIDLDELINTSNKYIPNNRFKLIKILEKDSLIMDEFNFEKKRLENINKIRNSLPLSHDKDSDMFIADERYAYVRFLRQKAVKYTRDNEKISFSRKLDFWITGKYTALPVFLISILSVFYITFGPVGVALKNLCERFINASMIQSVERILHYFGASDWSRSLVLGAIIGGVGSVISFLPQVALLFTMLSLLEDCGYMARAAFIMDKPLRKIGLSGRAFVPLMMGFGCTVPAVLGTKILENKKDKNLAVFLIPFMSCSAKMPVYLLFVSSFFPNHRTLAILCLYMIGVIVAALSAFIFRDTLFKGEPAPFIMEIPEYKRPSLKNVWSAVWERTRDFIERAGTVILLASVVVWFLQSFSCDFKWVTDNSQSILAVLGSKIAPLFTVCGFNDWRACVALITGVMAKESIVSTFSVLYSAETSAELGYMLTNSFSLYSAISFLVFVLLYTPCVAALSAIHKEFSDFKLTAVFVFYQLFIAFTLSALTFQILTFCSRIFS